jgi:hypothetical protein
MVRSHLKSTSPMLKLRSWQALASDLPPHE